MDHIERLARMQDIINGLRYGEPDTSVARMWIIQDTKVHLINEVFGMQQLDFNEVATPDDLVVTTWDLSNLNAINQKTYTIPNPVSMETLDNRDQTVLEAAKNYFASQGKIVQSGVSDAKAVTLTDPETGRPLLTGWDEATELGIRDATKFVPDLVRLSMLQERASSPDTPMTWALESNGQDLHVITWYPSDDSGRAHAQLKHFQYDLVGDIAEVNLILMVTNLRIAPGELTTERFMMSTQRILDWYQREARHPTNEFTTEPDWQPPTYAQADILPAGGQGQLIYRGQAVPKWSELTRQAATAYLQGTHLDLRHVSDALQKTTMQKGSTMVDHIETQKNTIIDTVNNNESLLASIEGYAIGLEAVQNPQQSQVQSNEGVLAVASTIVERAVTLIQSADRASGAEPHIFSNEEIASAKQDVSTKIMDHAQSLRDEKLNNVPQQIRKDDAKTSEKFPKVNVPHQWVHPYQMTSKDGRVFEKVIVNIPNNVKLNGIDITGYSVDRFMNKGMQEDKANGRPVTISFAPDKPVTIFRGKGSDRETITIDNPWDLCKAIKAGQEAFKLQQQEQREAHSESTEHKAEERQQSQADTDQPVTTPPKIERNTNLQSDFSKDSHSKDKPAGREDFLANMGKMSDMKRAQKVPSSSHEHSRTAR